jgi:hypothetical protein
MSSEHIFDISIKMILTEEAVTSSKTNLQAAGSEPSAKLKMAYVPNK